MCSSSCPSFIFLIAFNAFNSLITLSNLFGLNGFIVSVESLCCSAAGRTAAGRTAAGRTCAAGRTAAGRTAAGRTAAGRTCAAKNVSIAFFILPRISLSSTNGPKLINTSKQKDNTFSCNFACFRGLPATLAGILIFSNN
jgi:hypothetical protein